MEVRNYEVSEVHKTLLTNKTTFTQTTEKMERGRTEDNTQLPQTMDSDLDYLTQMKDTDGKDQQVLRK